MHIEQGPVLEARNLPLGVVTAIIGQTYLNVELLGEAGHAGTVPMLLRRDALAGAAEAILLGETLARDTKGEVVATVGRMTVAPGATNVIPANVVVIFDIRSGSEAARAKLAETLKSGVREIADRRHLGLTITSTARGRDHAMRSRMCRTVLARRSARSAPSRCGSVPARDMTGRRWRSSARSACCSCAAAAGSVTTRWSTPIRRTWASAVAALIGFIERFDPAQAA